MFEFLQEVGLEVLDVWVEANGDMWIYMPEHALEIRAIRKKDWSRETLAEYFDKWVESRYEEFYVRVPMGKNYLGEDSYDELYWPNHFDEVLFVICTNIYSRRNLEEREFKRVLLTMA